MVTRQTPAGDGSACPPCRSWQRCREKTRSPVNEASMVVAWTFAQPRGAADPQSSVAAEQTAPALATLSITSFLRIQGGWWVAPLLVWPGPARSHSRGDSWLSTWPSSIPLHNGVPCGRQEDLVVQGSPPRGWRCSNRDHDDIGTAVPACPRSRRMDGVGRGAYVSTELLEKF